MRASALLLLTLALTACGTGNDKDSGQTPVKDSSSSPADEGLGSDIGLDDVTTTDSACASSTFVAEQAPASLIFVLDGSESMNDSGKWSRPRSRSSPPSIRTPSTRCRSASS